MVSICNVKINIVAKAQAMDAQGAAEGAEVTIHLSVNFDMKVNEGGVVDSGVQAPPQAPTLRLNHPRKQAAPKRLSPPRSRRARPAPKPKMNIIMTDSDSDSDPDASPY